MLKVHIELTEEQKQKLIPIQDKLMQSNEKGKPGMVLAQVLFTGWDAVAVVKFIPNEKGLKIQQAVGTKVKGKNLMTDAMTRRRLAKARKE
jgi:hypothetical protein